MYVGFYHFCLQTCAQALYQLTADDQYVSEDHLLNLCLLPDGSYGQLYTHVQALLNPMKNDAVVAHLTLNECQNIVDAPLEQLFVSAELRKSPEVNFTIDTS